MEWNWNKLQLLKIPIQIKQIVETEGKIDTPYTCVHDRSILRVGTYISINNSGMEIFVYVSKSLFLLKWCGLVRWLYKAHGHNVEYSTFII